MKLKPKFDLLLILSVLFQGCNTLYSSRTTNIEVVVPGKIAISPEYKKVAVRYNNCNITQNPYFASYSEDNKIFLDTSNIDSVASEVYFQLFVEHLKSQNFFDSIVELEPFDYSGVQIIDTSKNKVDTFIDTFYIDDENPPKHAVSNLADLLKSFPSKQTNVLETKIIDPEFGLYSKEEIQQIADSTSADLLFSLDYFASVDRFDYIKYTSFTGTESIFIIVLWNIYDLNKQNLNFFYTKSDTITWNSRAEMLQYAKKMLPPRKDAILNAADIAGTRFAEFLVPHWIEVQRMYYHSNQVDLKKTDKLIKENKWLEAAKIWKANVNNPNKNIAAKSMFNLGLACEMEGNLDAAMDWTVKSFYVFGNKNEVHYTNCMEYIQILAQRKFDLRTINMQVNADVSGPVENNNE